MRYLVVLVMIVLLPLRGWAGDSMATQMAGSHIAIESGASYAHKMGAAATFDQQKQAAHDCHDVLAGQPHSGQTESNMSESGHCGTCQACQACHTVALLPALIEVAASLSSPQMRLTRIAFTSAAAALGQKPPIS